MKLSELFFNIEKEIFGNENIEVEGLSYDSREIFKGYIFVGVGRCNHLKSIIRYQILWLT